MNEASPRPPRADADPVAAGERWLVANRDVIDASLAELRLLLERRLRWLRSLNRHDPLAAHRGEVISDERADWLVAGSDRAAEQAFRDGDGESRALTARIAASRAEIAARRAALIDAGAPATLDLLARGFALSPLEQGIVLMGLAPCVDPGFEQLYAYAQDRIGAGAPTPHLASALLESDDGAAPSLWRTIAPDAPLRHFQLVRVGTEGDGGVASALAPLSIDSRLADYLLGWNYLDPRVRAALRPMPATLLPDGHAGLVDRLEAVLGTGQRPLINLIEPAGAAGAAVAAEFCRRNGLGLLRLRPERLPDDTAERLRLIRLIDREAALLRFALYVETQDGPVTPEAGRGEEKLDDALTQLGAISFVASGTARMSERDTQRLHVPMPDFAARRALWRRALKGAGDVDIDALVQQFELGPSDVLRAAAAAQAENASDPATRVWQACRDVAARDLADLAQRVAPANLWEDLVLPTKPLAQLREMADQAANRARVYESWGFGRKLARGRGITALFAGPSGVGKTMAAEVIAGHLRLDLYRVDLAGIVSKYIGETEKNLRRVFDAAERGGAVLFFDEADSLFGKRSEVKDSHDRYANIEVSYLLQRMEEYRGVAVLATNMKGHLDQAFLRRLRFVVDFPFPSSAERVAIWRKAFPPEAPLGPIDFDALGRLEIAGGNIKIIALNAAFLAAENGTRIGAEHVVRAARQEFEKIDKPLPSAVLALLQGGATP